MIDLIQVWSEETLGQVLHHISEQMLYPSSQQPVAVLIEFQATDTIVILKFKLLCIVVVPHVLWNVHN